MRVGILLALTLALCIPHRAVAADKPNISTNYFGTDVPNWPPYCFIENDRTVGMPTEFLPAALLSD